MDINIVHIDPKTRKISFKFNIVPRQTRGIEGLLQLVAKTILTTPGTDVWSKAYGGGLLSYHLNVHSKQQARINADVMSIIKKSEEQIKKIQSPLTLEDDEKLDSLKFLGIEWLSKDTSIIIKVLVTAASGLSADIRLPNQLGTEQIDDVEDVQSVPPPSIYNSKPNE